MKTPTLVLRAILWASLSGGCSLIDLSELQDGVAEAGGGAGGMGATGTSSDASVEVGGRPTLVDSGAGGATAGGNNVGQAGDGAGGVAGTTGDAGLGGALPNSGGGSGGTQTSIPATCGDGNEDEGEACDTAGESATCNADCTLPVCGDARLNTAAGEECDEGGVTTGCTHDCQDFSCSDDCACSARLGHLYMYCAAEETAADIEARCDALGMHSVILDDAAEDFFVRTLANTTDRLHIGATDGPDAADEGRWIWADRRQFWTGNAAGEVVGGGYANWTPGQPNNLNDEEDCGQYAANQWNDIRCDLPLPSLCELTPARSSLCGDGSLDFGEACDATEETSSCDEDCSVPACGDGVLNTAADEICDDNNGVATDACNECMPTGLLALFPADENNRPVARSHVSELSLGRGTLFSLSGNGLVSTGEYAEIFGTTAATSLLDIDGKITLALEVQFTSTPATEAWLIGHGDTTNGVSLRVSGTTLSGGSTEDGASLFATATPNLFDAAWHHVALSYDDVAWQLYVDGEAAGDAAPSDQGAVPSNANWTVFGTAANTELVPNDTRVRQLRIYDRELSAEEIAVIAAL